MRWIRKARRERYPIQVDSFKGQWMIEEDQVVKARVYWLKKDSTEGERNQDQLERKASRLMRR